MTFSEDLAKKLPERLSEPMAGGLLLAATIIWQAALNGLVTNDVAAKLGNELCTHALIINPGAMAFLIDVLETGEYVDEDHMACDRCDP